MNLRFLPVFIVVFFLTIIASTDSKASHLMGADISYQCINADSNQYLITLNLYRDCAGIGAPFTVPINFTSDLCGQSFSSTLAQLPPGNAVPGGTPHEVTQLCDSLVDSSSCNGGNFPGVELYTYQALVTFPDTCEDWVISYSSCCRNDLITNLANPASDGLYVEATLDNTDTCNNSPVFTNLPVTYICANQLFNYNHGAIDADGDSLVYTLVNPLDGPNAPLGYAAGFDSVNPILTTPPNTFLLDSATGQLTFTPNGQQIAVVTFLVREYRNGQLIGSTMRGYAGHYPELTWL